MWIWNDGDFRPMQWFWQALHWAIRAHNCRSLCFPNPICGPRLFCPPKAEAWSPLRFPLPKRLSLGNETFDLWTFDPLECFGSPDDPDIYLGEMYIRNEMCFQIFGIFDFQELSRTFKNFQELSRTFGNFQQLSRTFGNHQGFWRSQKSQNSQIFQKLQNLFFVSFSRTFVNFRELSRTFKNFWECSGIFKNPKESQRPQKSQ